MARTEKGLTLGAWLTAFAWAAASCSLAISDGYDDGACGSSAKACNGSCASITDPTVGCSQPGCAPCPLANATPKCSPDNTCAIKECDPGFMVCNGDPSMGCVVDVENDPMNCSQCGCQCGTNDPTNCPSTQQVQSIANGGPGCSGGQCVIGSCDPGYGDCDGLLDGGCETLLNTAANCGICGNVCTPPCVCGCAPDASAADCVCQEPDGGSCAASGSQPADGGLD